MNKNYVIQWKSTVNGRAGKGTKVFEQGEAERLVEELNREYPQILHEAVPAEAAPLANEAEPAHAGTTTLLAIA
ncbi:MAG TPA: hypothetical protein VEH04_17670 [Verrucomicrobiae bacterium]|nr:hypothetical protein [Verrucomicrobiae bacterium]